jgi:hypothetical protein
METALTMTQCTNAFCIQSPRLQTAFPISLPESLVLLMPAFLP